MTSGKKLALAILVTSGVVITAMAYEGNQREEAAAAFDQSTAGTIAKVEEAVDQAESDELDPSDIRSARNSVNEAKAGNAAIRQVMTGVNTLDLTPFLIDANQSLVRHKLLDATNQLVRSYRAQNCTMSGRRMSEPVNGIAAVEIFYEPKPGAEPALAARVCQREVIILPD